MGMTIRFWGVRGSIPSPGPETAEVGGNTSCVEVECGDTRIILDAGTGIRPLGSRLVEQHELQIHLLLSHYHWDHIHGLPFFAPVYLPSAKLEVFGAAKLRSLHDVLGGQMAYPVFPIAFDDLTSHWSLHHLRSGDQFYVGGAWVTAMMLNHPGGALAYRIEYEGRSVVYATDTEHQAGVPRRNGWIQIQGGLGPLDLRDRLRDRSRGEGRAVRPLSPRSPADRCPGGTARGARAQSLRRLGRREGGSDDRARLESPQMGSEPERAQGVCLKPPRCHRPAASRCRADHVLLRSGAANCSQPPAQASTHR
jgi:glyoxylase-like metal-dependent hydrolase (beta-lactamase superfamily II)